VSLSIHVAVFNLLGTLCSQVRGDNLILYFHLVHPRLGFPSFCVIYRGFGKFNSLELLRAAVAEFPWETAQPLVESLGFMLEFS